MKFFSNFDTKIKINCIEEHIQQYGKENVLCLSRSGLYLFVKVIRPFFWFVVLDISLAFFFYYIFDQSYLFPIILVIFLVSIPFMIYLLGKYIDYTLDFVVVGPDALIEYNQSGIFTKKVVTVNEKSIKTVTVERNGFLYSIFNNGDIVFFSEGDDLRGDITLRYISYPEKKRAQIAKIMHKD